MISERSVCKVGLLWHSVTSDNLGVGALTFGQMVLIKKAANLKGVDVIFLIVGTRGSTPYPLDQFDVENTSEFALRAFKAGDFSAISLLRRANIVFDIGEGDSFADIYGNKRLTIQVAAKLLARVFGKKLILSPQTIGPFKSTIGKILGTLGMSIATRIYARDHLSMAVLQQSNYRDRATEVIDVAFALPFQKGVSNDDGLVRIGLNVSGLLYNGGYGGKNEFNLTLDYKGLIEQVCEYFSNQDGVELYLVPHVISDSLEVEDDLRASSKLAVRYPKLKMAPRFKSPIEAKSFISGLDFFAGARMHACIAAFSSGVPVVPLAYSRKFNGLFNSLGYKHVLDCLTSDTESGFQFLIQSFERRQILALEVQAGNKIASSKLEKYVNELSSLFNA